VINSRSNPASLVDLPNPLGTLLKTIPSSAANTAVREVLIEKGSTSYQARHYSDKERAEITKEL